MIHFDVITKINEVVHKQQLKIEGREEKNRAPNLIIHNIPEGKIRIGNRELTSDVDKVTYMIEIAKLDVAPSEIEFTRRLGKINDRGMRPLKLAFKDKDNKFKILNKRKQISQNEDLSCVFGGKIFVNADTSFLVRKEENRLRQKIKDLKVEHPNDWIYLRSGSLYHNGRVIDKVNVENCLF